MPVFKPTLAFYTEDEQIYPLNIAQIDIKKTDLYFRYNDGDYEGEVIATSDDGFSFFGDDIYDGEKSGIKIDIFYQHDSIAFIGLIEEESNMIIKATK